jgi:chemotaxis protein histidine kinase CheA
MDAKELRAQLMPTFLEDLEGQVAILREGADLLRDAPGYEAGADRLESVLRAAHTLKGAAGAVGVDLVADASRALEQALARARVDGWSADAELAALVRDGAGVIEDAGRRLSKSESLAGSPLEVFVAGLEQR